HNLDAKAPEYVDFKTKFEVRKDSEGQTLNINVGPLLHQEKTEPVTPPPPTAVVAPPPLKPVDEGPPMPTLKWVAIGAAGAGVVALTVGTVMALSAKSKWNDAQAMNCDSMGVCKTQAGADLVNDAGSKASLSTVMFVA